ATCGGCTLQHAAAPLVAAFKTERVASALAAQSLAAQSLTAQGLDAPVRPILTVPERSRRRIALGARRLRNGTLIGYRQRGSDQIVAVTDCPVATPALTAAIPRLAPLVTALASRKGMLRITLTEAEGGIDAAVEGARPPDGPTAARLPAMAAEAGLARLAVLAVTDGSGAGEITITHRPPAQTLGAARVVPPPGAFLQPTREGTAHLLDAIREALGPIDRARRIADLFAGCGTFALPLSAMAQVHAVELDGPSLEALAAGWRAAAPTAGLARLTTERRNLFRRPLVAEELRPFAAIVIDPPFAGAEAQMRALAASAVPRIAAVSCNPVSFARDAAILAAGGYVLDWVQPVDQFRWSGHVEIVAALRRA
ncbi:MAG: class I SAM-dependent RNA methyltransferase, partial [Pseudomonadota bacterium]